MNAAHHHHGPKLSRNQSEVLSCLRKAKEPMSAYAILDRVRTVGISHPPTVYRALNELMQKGMVHRLQSRSAFVACGHGGCDGKFAFAICRQCGKVVEIPLSDKGQSALLGLAPDQIAPEQVTLEIVGLCQSCRAA
jgi:Fur family zinc uptake transcriptional regulator